MSDIHDFANVHLDRRCFVIGSGPSLNQQDLSPLAHEITFTCNRGYLLWPRLGAPSTYWCVEDVLDVEQFGVEFRRLNGTVKLIADDIGELGNDSVLVPFVRERFEIEGVCPNCRTPYDASSYRATSTPDKHEQWLCDDCGLAVVTTPAGINVGRNVVGPRFALEPPFMWGATVSYMMIQLAAYMGCDPIYLLGHDFKYARSERLKCGDVWRNDGPDVDHFDADYWPIGSQAFRADLPRMHTAFVAARTACDAIGVRVVNLTPGSNLDVFDVDELSEVLRG